MCNLHWCYTFCTGVTLFTLVLHLNCTALSQSESSNFFMCIINQFICSDSLKSVLQNLCVMKEEQQFYYYLYYYIILRHIVVNHLLPALHRPQYTLRPSRSFDVNLETPTARNSFINFYCFRVNSSGQP